MAATEICCICQDAVSDHVVLPCCDQRVHNSCFFQYLSTRTTIGMTCPLCRHPLTNKQESESDNESYIESESESDASDDLFCEMKEAFARGKRKFVRHGGSLEHRWCKVPDKHARRVRQTQQKLIETKNIVHTIEQKLKTEKAAFCDSAIKTIQTMEEHTRRRRSRGSDRRRRSRH